MTTYKQHFACFDCRKSFKRRLLRDIKQGQPDSLAATCPECGSLMANMGLDFKSPKNDDLKAWQHMRNLFVVGVTFHSCGCTGPGYIPATTQKLVEYLQEKKRGYVENLRFWLSREEPRTKQELEKDKVENSSYRWSVPDNLYDKKGRVSNADAIKYWSERIEEIDRNILKVDCYDKGQFAGKTIYNV